MEDKKTVVVKTFKNGIRVLINPELTDFDAVLTEVAKRFCEGRAFFGDSTVALSIEGREFSSEEELLILETINLNCDLNVICIVDENEKHGRPFKRAVSAIEERLDAKDRGYFYRGSVTDAQTLKFDEGVIIIGDVNPGCKVISGGNIIVLGGLYGEAYVEASDNTSKNFVIALEMAPEKLTLGDKSFEPPVKPKWGIKHKLQPKMAYLKDGEIVFDNVSKNAVESVYAL